MTLGKKLAFIAIAGSCAAAVGSVFLLSANAARSRAERGRKAFSHALPQMDANHLVVTVVEVNYGPGESSAAHSHPCPVIGYIAEGALRFQVKGEAEAIYKAGESFYEPPNGVHLVSANASQTEPAKLIAYFVCDHEGPLSVPPIGEKQP
jgi:quercetin dioxygenase-like cupin family protein